MSQIAVSSTGTEFELQNVAPIGLSNDSEGTGTSVTARLSVVIVNYRQWHETAALVTQILRSDAAQRGDVEVFVVDNDSPWSALAERMRHWRGMTLRRLAGNRGFARAVNEASRFSRSDWELLLNPDMTLEDGFIDEVMASCSKLDTCEPHVGIVGFGLRNSDGTPQLSTGDFSGFFGTVGRLLLPRRRRKYRAVSSNQPCSVDWVTGCAMLVKRACLENLNGFDDSYVLYYEDMDLCCRAWAKGWSVRHDPRSSAIHHNPTHLRPITPALRLVARHSLLTYARRHWRRWQFHLLAGFIRLEAWARRRRAQWRRQLVAAETFAEMGAMAREMAAGNLNSARGRVKHAAQGVNLRGS